MAYGTSYAHGSSMESQDGEEAWEGARSQTSVKALRLSYTATRHDYPWRDGVGPISKTGQGG